MIKEFDFDEYYLINGIGTWKVEEVERYISGKETILFSNIKTGEKIEVVLGSDLFKTITIKDDNIPKKSISIEQMEILRNERVLPNEFKMNFECDFCDNFISQVIMIPKKLGSTKDFISICKSCLYKMIDRLDKNMIDNFESDFENSRENNNKKNNMTPLQREYASLIAMSVAGCLAGSVKFKSFQTTVEEVATLLKKLEEQEQEDFES